MLRSPPSRRRGLKFFVLRNGLLCYCRLLRGGVDWNPTKAIWAPGIWRSPPSRRRGLKLFFAPTHALPLFVASFAEAWIEIRVKRAIFKCVACRLLRGGVDWNYYGVVLLWLEVCRLLRGGVDWNRLVVCSKSRGTESPPSRRRGLKFKFAVSSDF